MARSSKKLIARKKRIRRVRQKVNGTADRPRLRVFRSLNHIYAQVIDDAKGVTLTASSSLDKDIKAAGGSKTDMAQKVGESVAQKAKGLGISQVVFDRGGNIYHVRVKALSDGAREGGLEF